MIIDLILNRKDGVPYNPKQFYNDVANYGDIGNDIAEALDNGKEEDVQHELVKYIITNDYNPELINYITSVKWLTQTTICPDCGGYDGEHLRASCNE